MMKQDWLRGVKRTPEDFDRLVFLIMNSFPERRYTARQISEYMAPYNGSMKPDVNRVLRSMKRLKGKGKITLVYHRERGWYGWYEGSVQ